MSADKKWEEYREQFTGERCLNIKHASGLTITVCPKKGYRSVYAVFGTRYGSIDTVFYPDGDDKPTEVPAGIAHYLEHKLFESEDNDAFSRFAKTGASANAYTSFDKTAYLFTCTDNFEKSLHILLDFVQSPYFTEQTVRKEQGIIGQEIRMGEDSPARRVFFNLMRSLYFKHPVKTEIAGTVESIAEITPELLYKCYNTFYNLHNMVLAVSGDITPEQVLSVADKALKPAQNRHVVRAAVREPRGVVKPRVEQRMPVASPLFYYGYKDCFPDGKSYRTPKQLAAAGVLLEIMAGKSSSLYNSLMDKGLINSSFDADYFDGPGYGVWLFGGESSDPDAVAQSIRDEIIRLRGQGVPREDFENAKSALYGKQVASLNEVDTVSDSLMADYFADRPPFSAVGAAAALTHGDVTQLLETCFLDEQASLSVILPSNRDAADG